MLDVVNDKDLRQSLITRGYKYVERNGWDQKKKVYLDLIDSLSTELFADVQSVPGSASAIERDNQRKTSADPFTEGVGSVAVKLNDPSSVSSLKGR